MAAQVYDIYIERGADWELPLKYKDKDGVVVNITNYTIEAEIKEMADLSAAVTLPITVQLTDATNGEFLLSLTKAQTSSLTDAIGPNYQYKKEYAYDVLITPGGGKTKRMLNGKANVSPGVTS